MGWVGCLRYPAIEADTAVVYLKSPLYRATIHTAISSLAPPHGCIDPFRLVSIDALPPFCLDETVLVLESDDPNNMQTQSIVQHLKDRLDSDHMLLAALRPFDLSNSLFSLLFYYFYQQILFRKIILGFVP